MSWCSFYELCQEELERSVPISGPGAARSRKNSICCCTSNQSQLMAGWCGVRMMGGMEEQSVDTAVTTSKAFSTLSSTKNCTPSSRRRLPLEYLPWMGLMVRLWGCRGAQPRSIRGAVHPWR